MNTYQLDALSLRCIRMEVDDENRKEYSPVFLQAYNQAYLEICKSILHPWKWEEIALENGEFSLSDLDEAQTRIIKASSIAGGSEKGGYDYDVVMLGTTTAAVMGYAGSSAFICYEYAPQPLTNDEPDNENGGGENPEPKLIIGDINQQALAYFAASFYYATAKKAGTAEYWQQIYLRACANITSPSAPPAAMTRNLFNF